MTFTEPAHAGPADQYLGQRTLVTQIWYPRARGAARPFPLLLFAPGFLQCPGAYSDLAANTCCTDRRLKAVAVLSGAEWPPMPGRYFPGGAPPMLFTQGSADEINPPWASLQLYRADGASARYYLDLFGASHLIPYEGTNPVERLTARVTLAFFDRYVLGQPDALETMTRGGNVTGTAALVSGGQPPP